MTNLTAKVYNKSTLFLLPILKKNINFWKEHSLYNAYISDVNNKEDFENKLFCLCVDNKGKNENLTSNNSFSYCYTPKEDDNSLIMYVYNIPDNTINEYYTFLKSEYSKFSTEYKDCILDFHNINRLKARYEIPMHLKPEKPVITQILFPKDSDRKKYIQDKYGCKYEPYWEISSRINEKEVFNLNLIT